MQFLIRLRKMQKSRIGLIAGKGELPLEFLKSAKERNVSVVTFALEGITDRKVSELSEETVWIKPFKLGKLLKEIEKRKIERITSLGKIEHKVAFNLSGFDLKAIKVLASVRDFKPETLIRAVFNEIEKLKVDIFSPEEFLEHLLLKKGKVLGITPSEETLREMKRGMEIAREIASLDIGQTVVLKNGTVVAVEGVEGTDECIRRGAELSGKGFIVCKAARKKQDMRIDVPTVGVETVKLVKKLGGKGIAVEGGKTYVVTPEKVEELCKKFKLTFVAL
ncbi:hypothetical protein SAMN06269117_10393 [Balnearium lithotrophicum]|uniref:DUF1009 domain-containing protein n=1 Tax=Balnearium lithotrophicum TaxID=223788 RepID=A0A521B2G0_9BACT|nr:UDP-2,3-diacylglucosamine diphosphatase LpxI [Balnearium lithotrophicum]SMO41292.1 hypothetical protein SAMN06269117_10393 [Balnearium lithotrophicum]